MPIRGLSVIPTTLENGDGDDGNRSCGGGGGVGGMLMSRKVVYGVVGLAMVVAVIVGIVVGIRNSGGSSSSGGGEVKEFLESSEPPPPPSTTDSNQDDVVFESSQINCPAGAQAEACLSLGCVWSPKHHHPPPSGDDGGRLSSSSCYYPAPSLHGYTPDGPPSSVSPGHSSLTLTLKSTSARVVPNLKETLKVELFEYTEDFFRIKVSVEGESRYEVPVPLNLPQQSPSTPVSPSYSVSFTDNGGNFAIVVQRVHTGQVIFDTRVGGFTYADQYLQVSTRLPGPHLYGLGEGHHFSLVHDLNHITWPMFARDQGPAQPGRNLYGSHPMYQVMEGGGLSHVVLWLNSNAMEAETLPLPGLTLRAIGGIMDLYFFLGSSPMKALQGYLGVVGFPALPPYWSLGFQLCRYGYKSLNHLKEAVSRTRRNGIPQDVQYADIDHMDRRMDFTVDPENWSGLSAYIREVKSEGLRFIIILDPAINVEMPDEDYPSHTRALAKDVYIKWPKGMAPQHNYGAGDIMLGYVWPDNRTAFPDFLRSSTHEWWQDEIISLYQHLQFDGLWIDMNEPANFGTNEIKPWNWPEDQPDNWSLHCPTSTWDDPPYPTAAATVWGKRLSDKTLCMVARQGEDRQYRHYDVHNLYGWSQTQPTLQALQYVTGQRGLVVTRSTFPSSGRWAGHWLGDNTALWSHLRNSIIGMLEFNLFGIPYVGADICGFFGDTTEELCLRWMQLGAFYPYSRNHNQKDAIDHDPGLWPSVAEAGRVALTERYRLLPYLYTLHYLAHTKGLPVLRPLFFEFPEHNTTWDIDDQFLWGPWLMVAPVIEQGMVTRHVYFPNAKWYDYYTGQSVEGLRWGGVQEVWAPLFHLPLYVRGGGVLPTQRPRSNTKLSRSEPLGLVIAPDWEGRATGLLYWDDGESIDPIESGNFFMAEITYDNTDVTWRVQKAWWRGGEVPVLSDLRIFNVTTRPSHLTLNLLRLAKGDWHYDDATQVLEIYDLELDATVNFTLSWEHHLDYTLPCPLSYADLVGDSQVVTRDMCETRNCRWEATSQSCWIPPAADYGLEFTSIKPTKLTSGYQAVLRPRGIPLYPGAIPTVGFQVFYYSDYLLRFKFYDTDALRYEVPNNLNLPVEGSINPLYRLVTPHHPQDGDLFYFYVERVDSGTILFDTRLGGLTVTDQFLSVTTRLASRNVYGLGENAHTTFRHNLTDPLVWPIFSRDQGPAPGDGQQMNLYGAHPYYQVMENDGRSHGVLLLNSNAMDYQLLDFPALTFRTIGGVLDFYLVLGPEPETVVSQYTSLIGRPVMPPYWSLGFQLCRYGHPNLTSVQEAVNRTLEAGIPLDVVYGDIDYMDRRLDFTVDPDNYADLAQYVTETLQKEHGTRFIAILDPAINAELGEDEYPPHQRAMSQGAYITWPPDTNTTVIEENHAGTQHASDIMLGYVWPDNRTAFPSFLSVAGQEWWKEEIRIFYREHIKFDGLWIDMNEPANFGTNEAKPWNWPEDRHDNWSLNCPTTTWDDPPYVTKASAAGPTHRMSDKTLCLAAQDGSYTHYNVHNIYGWAQTQPTYSVVQELTRQRGLVVTRSTFPGSGQWSGHWLGDNRSRWTDMAHSIIGMLEFNLFGIPYVGADICGFFEDTTEELCQRWMQLGAFYPYSRNHNQKDAIEQDPGLWPETVALSAKKALEIRYRLLPYLYTLFYLAHTRGSTVVRPLHHEFPKDRTTLGLDDQFLWGSGFMVSPVLQKGRIQRDVYFPQDNWFDYYTGTPITSPGEWTSIPAPLDTIPLHIRGGTIIPTHQFPTTTTTSPGIIKNTRQAQQEGRMGLLVGVGQDRRASGTLFWDDGEGVDTIERGDYGLVKYEFIQNILVSTTEKQHYLLENLTLTEIVVLGVERSPKQVIYNGVTLEPSSSSSSSSYVYEPGYMRLTITLISHQHSLAVPLRLQLQGIWQYEVEMS
ncbi:hypothetical protein Pcinc_022087 [Petrolisthes cinctipes]|uniref:alpha-glucosidase n=1 Tax=Petrolisthes cinctipes TaxID=88211 RepID=A0AAE1FER8_PETCI|nr:hypothetical protein Pcinc_022087 [Petrolisthes cinctipes]